MDTFRIHQSLPSFLLVSLLLLLFFLIPSSSSAQEDNHQQYSACSPFPLYCARGEPPLSISYPFWTKGRPEYCRYPGKELEISCNDTDDSAEIVIESRKYHVTYIDYENQRATIVDKSYYFENPPKTCLHPSTNTILDFKFFNFTDRDLNLTFLYDCPSHTPKEDPSFFKFLNCGDDAYFIILRPDISERFRACKVMKIPILETNWDRLYHADPLNCMEVWNAVLASGFEVTWNAIDPEHHCPNCVKSNGHCGVNNEASPPQPSCYCNGIRHRTACPRSLPRVHKFRRKKLILGVATGVGIFLLTCLLISLVYSRRKSPSANSIVFWKKKTNDNCNVEAFLENYVAFVPKRFRYTELKKITNFFRDDLGQGGYGSVFKGKLNEGRLVAVKVLNNSKGGNGEEFINEVASIGRTYHVNVVALLGFCSEGSKRALVYEFMSKGSLEKFIFSDKQGERHILDCQKLFEIAVGIARGLKYLHRGCSTRILHFDIKPHNILLDDNFCPKISDFGLAKLCPQQESTVSMLDARGTVGYTAPEVFCRNIGGVSHKSDVYSYGMMVLEMIGGRKNIDAKVENTSEIYFPHWVYKHIEVKESLEVLGFGTKAEEEIARKMVLVGLWCIQTDPTNRPSTSKVVEMLEGSLGNLKMPPKPYFSSPSSHALPQRYTGKDSPLHYI